MANECYPSRYVMLTATSYHHAATPTPWVMLGGYISSPKPFQILLMVTTSVDGEFAIANSAWRR